MSEPDTCIPGEAYPLSSLQQTMLLQHLAAPGSGINIDQIVCRLNEDVDSAQLQRAWSAAIARHEVCRTRFAWEGLEQPAQWPERAADVRIVSWDLDELPGSGLEEKLAGFLDRDRALSFDLNRAPLVRLSLIKGDTASFYLVWTFHHIVIDRRSHYLVLNDAFGRYDALCAGEAHSFDQGPRFQDFIEWNGRLDHQDSQPFWRRYLSGIEAPTRPLLSRGSASRTSPGGYVHGELELDPQTSSDLVRGAREAGVALSTFVQGAWGLLLGKYSGEDDLVFGSTWANRFATIEDAGSVAGLFMNHLPMRIRIDPDQKVSDWLRYIRECQVELRNHAHTPLSALSEWGVLPGPATLFPSILIFDNYDLTEKLHSNGAKWACRRFSLVERTGFPLTVHVSGGARIRIRMVADEGFFSQSDVQDLIEHYGVLLEGLPRSVDLPVHQVPVLNHSEIKALFSEKDQAKPAEIPFRSIHEMFEAQAAATPDSIAVACNGQALSYKELSRRSRKLASRLVEEGIGPERLVGVALGRSVDVLVALLGVLKSGGAYVPLDPAFPEDRIDYMVGDSGCSVIVTESAHEKRFDPGSIQRISIDTEWPSIDRRPELPLPSAVDPENLAYVIYTSGSTGDPKGVMVQHGNVLEFFQGMDGCLHGESPGTWLAVTSLSFDISVLELLWTICRGYKVVMTGEEDWKTRSPKVDSLEPVRRLEFSLFYFSSSAGQAGPDRYRLLLEGARFADQNGFFAVWTPERHFHDFGGLYPNPAVTGAAVAAVTNHVRILSGSLVSPLHSALRIAEDWSVIDNISGGRAGISFASGWHPNDFAIAPQNFADRKTLMFEQIETVRKLWRGERVEVESPGNKSIAVTTYPRPVQEDLPIWITAANSPDTFRMAGERGFNILTHLLGQSIEELSEKIASYRQAWKAGGHGPGTGHVSLMLHTFVGEDLEQVKQAVRGPMKDYLKSAMNLVQLASWYFPAYGIQRGDEFDTSAPLSQADQDTILEHSFERYFETSALLGTPESCLETAARLKRAGVDEVACLIDFGLDDDVVLSHLQYLNAVKTLANLGSGGVLAQSARSSAERQLQSSAITHLQCTPSFARMLKLDGALEERFSALRMLLIGGEVFPVSLAEELLGSFTGKILNMYGPTETTVWSCCHPVTDAANPIPIGRPLAGERVFILDRRLQPLPTWAPGELCIGGSGVTRGYLGRPELSAEKFVSFSHADYRGKIYKTGDLARFRSDGVIEFLGRIDRQVKVRGYRVEPGEIETALERHPALVSAAVDMRSDNSGSDQLVAYLVCKGDSRPTIPDLRKFLLSSLPEFMLPSVYLFLDHLPRTPNGKIDFKALPAPEPVRPDLGSEFRAPESSTEIALAALWAKILGIEKVGLFDNFFDLGGHSLLAVQTTVMIQQAFQVNLPLQAIFQAENLCSLAAAIDHKLQNPVVQAGVNS